jgi:hypothetical protein
MGHLDRHMDLLCGKSGYSREVVPRVPKNLAIKVLFGVGSIIYCRDCNKTTYQNLCQGG